MSTWNSWKVRAIAIGLVTSTAMATGLVIANRTGREHDRPAPAAPSAAKAQAVKTEAVKSDAVKPEAEVPAAMAPAPPMQPPQAEVDACNVWAAQHAQSEDKAIAVVRHDVRTGALFGLSEKRKHDERYRAAYAICLRSRGYSV
jgi:type IV secretory pathway VirB10-like protein